MTGDRRSPSSTMTALLIAAISVLAFASGVVTGLATFGGRVAVLESQMLQLSSMQKDMRGMRDDTQRILLRLGMPDEDDTGASKGQ